MCRALQVLCGGTPANDEQAPNQFRIRPFCICIVLTLALGLALLIPGIVLRVETIPTPLYIDIHLCPTTQDGLSRNYVGSGEACSNSSEQRESMQWTDIDGLIVADAQYVAVVLKPPPNAILSGNLFFELWFGDELLLNHSESLIERGQSDITVESTQSFGPWIQMLNSFPTDVQHEQHCDQLGVGCPFHMTYPMVKHVMSNTGFVIPASSVLSHVSSSATTRLNTTKVPPYVQLFARNVTLLTRSVALSVPSSFQFQPQLLVSFHQYALSYVQAEGVRLIIRGSVILCFAIALASLGHFLHVRKKPKRMRAKS